MNTIFDILFFPISVFLGAIVGVLYPAENVAMRSRRKWALLSLGGCVAVFGLVFLLLKVVPDSPAVFVLSVVGLIFLFSFLICGKACADAAEGNKRR
jgi:hypothetical protein